MTINLQDLDVCLKTIKRIAATSYGHYALGGDPQIAACIVRLHDLAQEGQRLAEEIAGVVNAYDA